jgi:hypothetical protein
METDHTSSENARSNPQFHYFMGLFTAFLIALVVVVFIGYRIGLHTFKDRVLGIRGEPSYKEVMVLPPNILRQLMAHKAVIENAGNPTQQAKHNTVLTQPDVDLEYVLKPKTKITAYTMRSTLPYNWEPPLLVIDNKELPRLSPELREYLREQSVLSCMYSIDDQGLRRTVPVVASDRKVLVIGDSVAFGVGVDDHQTTPSYLQQKLGSSVQVVNAGVGGYSGRQALQVAEKHSLGGNFSALIYIACQNDFLSFSDTWVEEAEHLLTKLQTHAPRFGGNVVIYFQTYMEYTLFNMLGEEGWEAEAIQKTDVLDQHLARRCKELGFRYATWAEITTRFQQTAVSPFAAFALYVDHCHLSALGNSMAADVLYQTVQGIPLEPGKGWEDPKTSQQRLERGQVTLAEP